MVYIFYINRINVPTNLDRKKFVSAGGPEGDDILKNKCLVAGWYAQREADLQSDQNVKNITEKLVQLIIQMINYYI